MAEENDVATVGQLPRNIASGCEYRRREHQYSYGVWLAIATLLTTVAAVAGSVAGASILSNANQGTTWWYVAGILGIVGGSAGALTLALAPKTRADQHKLASAKFSGFRTKYYSLDRANPGSDMGQELKSLNDEKAEFESNPETPLPAGWAKFLRKSLDDRSKARRQKQQEKRAQRAQGTEEQRREPAGVSRVSDALRETEGIHNGLPYLLFTPRSPRQSELPMILFLHGSGECADSPHSVGSLDKLKKHSLPRLASEGRLPTVHGEQFPFLLVCPQTVGPFDHHAKRIFGLLDSLIQAHHIDPSRCYITGISLGGLGSWQLAGIEPRRFAALVPVSGHINVNEVKAVPETPVWLFSEGSRSDLKQGMSTLRDLRSPEAETIFTVDPHAGHNQPYWDEVYRQSHLYGWLLSHRLA